VRYRFADEVDPIEKVIRSSLLLLILGLLVMLLDLRVQGLNLLPDPIGCLLAALSIRRITSHITGAQRLLAHLSRSLYALIGATLFMLPDVYKISQHPASTLQYYPGSTISAAVWTGSFICELVALLSLALAIGEWASIIDDESLRRLSRTTLRLIVGATLGYGASLPLFLVTNGLGRDIVGPLGIIAIAVVVLSLLSRLVLIYLLVRTRRTSRAIVRALSRHMSNP
jgi:hypothetical protein